jgi:hypothetical protein
VKRTIIIEDKPGFNNIQNSASELFGETVTVRTIECIQMLGGLSIVVVAATKPYYYLHSQANLLGLTVLAGVCGAVLFLTFFAPELVFAAYEAARTSILKSAYQLQAELDELIPLTGELDAAGIVSLNEELTYEDYAVRRSPSHMRTSIWSTLE